VTHKPLELHTTEAGSGPTVVFLHGLDSDSSVWASAVELLLDDHRCVLVDLPGHGESPAPDDASTYSRQAVLDQLDHVLDRYPSPVVLVGHSLGGYLGLAHVLTRPGVLAGLVLVSTGPGFRDAQARESWNERVEANIPKYTVGPAAATIAYHVDSMVIDRITELRIPVELVIGSHDRAFIGANDYFERKLTNVRRTTVEGARHYVMKSNPEAVAASVRSLASRLP